MTDTYRVLVTGSRLWTDWETFHAAMGDQKRIADSLGRRLVVVHGYARKGADEFADAWARDNGVDVERHPALWRWQGVYNPQAGLARNRKMVRLGADVLLAFIRLGSRGASHCAALGEEAGIPVQRYSDDTPTSTGPPPRQPRGL